jgi:hypothetical protein
MSGWNGCELGRIDEYGVPRPRGTFDYGDNEHAMRDEMHRIGTEILQAADAIPLTSTAPDHARRAPTTR